MTGPIKAPSNIEVTLFKEFFFHGKRYENVLHFQFKNISHYPYYMLPREDRGYRSLRGQGHMRSSVLTWIECVFGGRNYKDYAKMLDYFSALPTTKIVKSGVYNAN